MKNFDTHCNKIAQKNTIAESKIVRFLRKYNLIRPGLTTTKITYRHVLSVDIVGLSRKILTEEEQAQKIEILNKNLVKCEVYQKTSKNMMIFKSTGDGFIIGVTEDITFPIELAIQLQEQLQQHNQTHDMTHQIKIRMGIHSGTSSLVKGVTEDEWGEAIVGATRIMSFGESDHILLSSKIALELIQLSIRYKLIFHPIGEYPTKHDTFYSVYSAFGENFGNSKLPTKRTEYEESYHQENSIEINSLTNPTFKKFIHWLIRLEPFHSDSGKPPMSAQRFVNLFKLMHECDLNVSEVLNLRKRDFDIKNKIIMIRYTNSDKVWKTTILPKDDGWIQKFLWYYNDDDLIFTIDSDIVNQYANDAKSLAGIN